jgi:hypothetical protein
MVATRPTSAWDRYAWVAGIIFVVALAAEAVVAFGVGLNQNDSAAKIANALYVHRERLLVIAYLSVVYAAMFPIYLSRLYNLLRGDTARTRVLGSLVLAGGVLFVALHAVSDVGITGEFPEHRAEVVLDGRRGNEQTGGDLRAGHPGRGQVRNLRLLRRQVRARPAPRAEV